MVRAVIILCLLAVSARAEWYTATMPDGRVVTVPVRTDPALDAAVGGVVTNTTMPEVAQEPPLPTTFESGIALLGDDGHWYRAEVDEGELIPIQISNSPLDPETAAVMCEAAKQARLAARQEWRLVTLGVKTGVVQVIRDTRSLLRVGTGIVDRVKASQVGTGANATAVRTGHRLLVDEVEVLARDKRELERTVRDLSIQVRELADIVRQKNLNVDTKNEPKE